MLAGLDLVTPDHMTQDGTLRVLENMCYQGDAERPLYAPVATPSEIVPATDLTGDILAISRQVRQQRGDLSSQADSGLTRYVVMTSRYIYLIDPDNANRTTQVYDFGDTVTTRKAQFASIGVAMLIAVSSGTGCGAPEELLYLEDDVCIEYAVPIPDEVTHLVALTSYGASNSPGLLPGMHAVRYAYRMRDGSIGVASTPQLVEITGLTGTADAVLKAAVAVGDNEFKTTSNALFNTYTLLQRSATNNNTVGWDGNTVVVDGETVRVQTVEYDSAANETILTLEPGTAFGSVHALGADIEFIKPSKVTFFVGNVTLPNANFSELISSVVVLLTPRMDKEEDAFELPYHQVAEITSLTFGDFVKFQDNESAIVGFELYEEGELTAHGIDAASCFAYNSRVLLGDVQYDYRVPVLPATNTGAAKNVRVGVVIEAQNGTFERISDAVALAAPGGGADADVVLRDSLISYPDRRVTEFRFYLDDTGYKLAGTLTAIPAPSGANMAYAFTDATHELTLTATAMPDAATTNAVLDRDPNRVLYTRVFQPFSLPARNSQQIGLTDDDGILGFAASGQPVETGQFGEYPLYVICKDSIHVAQVGTDVFLLSLAPIETNTGAVGRYAFANVGGVIAVATSRGVGVLSPRLSIISKPLHAEGGFLDLLTVNTALGYYADDDRQELWVATASDIYAFSLRHEGWFTMDRARKALHYTSDGLLGSDGDLQNEGAAAADVAVTMTLAPLNGGYVGSMKRYRNVTLRAAGTWTNLHLNISESTAYGAYTSIDQDIDNTDLDARTVHLPGGMLIAPVVTITGTASKTERLESFDAASTLHTPHRVPVS